MDKKAQVLLEGKASANWQNKWGYFLDLRKFCLEEAAKRGYTEEQYRRLMRRRKKDAEKFSNFVWDIRPSDGVPPTSSGFVGWRSRLEYSLEKMGTLYVSPLHTLPEEPHYSHIILG